MAAERREPHRHQRPQQQQAAERGQAQLHPPSREQAGQQVAQHRAHADHEQHQAGDRTGPHPAPFHLVGDLRNEQGHIAAHGIEKADAHRRTPERTVAPHLQHVREVMHPQAPAERLARLGPGRLGTGSLA